MLRRALLAVLSAATSFALGAQTPAVVSQARVDSTADVAFHAMLFPREVYVGQQASYQVGVFIADDVRARLRRNPEFVPPELRAVLGYDLSTASTYTRSVGSRRYEVHVFQRAIFPLVPGRHAIAPARLSYSLPLSTSFFSREESRTLRSESLSVVARETPPAPSGAGTAVGVLTLERRLDGDRRALRVGTPFVLTLAVRGIGNVALIPRPNLSLTWAQIVAGTERVELDTTGTLVRGVKEFDYIVTPTLAGAQTVPPQTYDYFDPYAERFSRTSTNELMLDIGRGGLVATGTDAEQARAPLSIRREYRGAVAPPISSHWAYWLALAMVPLPAAAASLVRRSRRRVDRGPGAHLQRLALAGAGPDQGAVRRAFTRALSDRLQIDAATLADTRRIERALRRRGVTRATALATARLHEELDAAVFDGVDRADDATLAPRAAALFEAIDSEATRRGRSLGRAGAVVALAFVCAGTLPAGQYAAEPEAFARGVALYDDGAYASAQRVFHAIAIGEPRAADAWSNAGTSAWQANDTAAAAASWQRALRLQPRDAETRERLDLIPAFRPGWFGDVPPLPVNTLAWIGLVVWVAAWGLQATPRRWANRAAIAAVSMAAVTLVVGVRLSEIATGKQTAVVRSAERLRNAPSLGAEAAEVVMPGETVRTPTARTSWTFVRLPDGREGWLPTESLVSLAQRR